MKIILFIGGKVGENIAQWFVENYISDIAIAFVESKSDPCYDILNKHVTTVEYVSQNETCELVKNLDIDVGFLVWFGPLLKEPLLSFPKQGFISMHPAYLPYTRGANFNIWPIVDSVPYGVSLFFVNDIKNGIDTGDIVETLEIPYSWEDTGETLRIKGQYYLIELFKKTYPRLRNAHIARTPQNMSIGFTHYKSELENASRIILDKPYSARELLNWLRARTYPGYPACTFTDGDNTYEVRVSITKKEHC